VAVDVRLLRPTLGGAGLWSLDAGHPQLLVALPGTYRLALDGPWMLEDTGLVVEAVTLDLGRLPWVSGAVTR
jgi:hypothetical protein